MAEATSTDYTLNPPADRRRPESIFTPVRKFLVRSSSSDDDEVEIMKMDADNNSVGSSKREAHFTLLPKRSSTRSSGESSSSDSAAGETKRTRMPPYRFRPRLKNIPAAAAGESSSSSVNFLPENEDDTRGWKQMHSSQTGDAMLTQPQPSKEAGNKNAMASPAALVNESMNSTQHVQNATAATSAFPPQPTPHQESSARVAGGSARVNQGGIYERGLTMNKRKEQTIQHLRAALLEDESKEATFHPKISKRAESLRRRSGTPEDAISAMRIKKRSMLLELPSNELNHSFTPRISRKSVEIVHHSRSTSAMSLPVGERLYHGYGLPNRESRRATTDDSPRPKSIIRTPSEINAHIASMYLFESQKQEAIREIQEELLKETAPTTPRVDPSEVVKRLTSPNTAGRPSLRKLVVDPSLEECTFAPKLSTSVSEYVSRAQQRGLTRWFLYFSKPNATTLSLEDLHGERAIPHADTARRIEAALTSRAGPAAAATEWTLQAFLRDLAAAEEEKGKEWPQLWREFPDGAAAGAAPTFRPRIDANSRALARRRGREAPAAPLPAHDRLFLPVRQQQLRRAQEELEGRQRHLLSEQLAAEKRSRAILRWRRQIAARAKTRPNGPREEAAPAPALPAPPSVQPRRPPPLAADLSILKRAAAELEGVLREKAAPRAVEKGVEVAQAPPAASPSTPTRPVGDSDAKPGDRMSTHDRPGSLSDAEAPPTTSLLLACADCRNPCSASTAERQNIEKENRRRLRQLGKSLYRKSRGLCQ